MEWIGRIRLSRKREREGPAKREGEGCSRSSQYELDRERPHPDPLPQAGEGAKTHGLVVKRPNLDKARRMRGVEATDAEKLLWRALRARQIEAKFRRQHPLGLYIVDFVSLQHGLVVELDGGQHNEAREVARDARRTAWLESQGFCVLRFWNNDVLGNLEGCLVAIQSALENLRYRLRESEGPAEHPHPGPLPQAGEGEGDDL